MNEDNNQSGNFNQASSSFSNDEKKQERKEAVEKVGQVAARGAADYFTGGKYEQLRKAPVVGKVAQGAEKVAGKAAHIANAASLGTMGRAANTLNKAGVLDAADKAVGMIGGGKGSDFPNNNTMPKNTNPNPEALNHSNNLSNKGLDKPKEDSKKTPSTGLPDNKKETKDTQNDNSSITATTEETDVVKKAVSFKLVGCLIILLLLGSFLLIPIIFMAGGMNVSSIMSNTDCSVSDSSNCSDDNATFGERFKNFIKYGTFGSNAEVFAEKITETYNNIGEREGMLINPSLLAATLVANIDDLKTEINKNGEAEINADVLKRLNYIEEVAELQLIEGSTVYYCNVKEVDGKNIYYTTVPEVIVDESLAVRGKCKASTVGQYVKLSETKYDEEEYFKNLESSVVLKELYPEYKGDTSLLVEKIRTQYMLYRIFNPDDSDVGNIPESLMSDEMVNLKAPVHGSYFITSPFGNRGTIYSGANVIADGVHLGIDVVPTDHVIYAAGDGVVTRANFESTGGNVVEITHTTSTGDRYISQYGHLKSFLVSKGDVVKSGDEIGIMGSTGAATGPHLHFGMKNLQTNEWLNPRNLFTEATNY